MAMWTSQIEFLKGLLKQTQATFIFFLISALLARMMPCTVEDAVRTLLLGLFGGYLVGICKAVIFSRDNSDRYLPQDYSEQNATIELSFRNLVNKPRGSLAIDFTLVFFVCGFLSYASTSIQRDIGPAGKFYLMQDTFAGLLFWMTLGLWVVDCSQYDRTSFT